MPLRLRTLLAGVLALIVMTASIAGFQTSPRSFFADGYVTITPAASPGWSIYRDNAEAFHFQVPALLQHADYGGWRNASDGTRMFVRVAYGSRDPAFYKRDTLLTPEYIETQTINGVRWTFWKFIHGAGYYCYRDNLAVALEVYAPDSRAVFSDSDTAILRQIVTTFVFDDVWQRLDRRIARLKIGDMVGDRRIKEIVRASDGVHGGYEDGILGAIGFEGSFTLSGGVVDESAHNGDWTGMFGLDVESAALLPRIGPLVYGVPVIGWSYSQEVQLNNVPPQFRHGLDAVVVDNLRETFPPRGGVPVVTADFLRPATLR